MHMTDQIVRKNKLTALMVTHSLTHALAYGTRTLLLHGGVVARNFSGQERASLNARQLLDLYGRMEGDLA
mgnify:FL=1